MGNLAENDRALLFLMDYETRTRVKLWGRARIVENDPLVERLMPAGYRAVPEHALLFTVEAWDANCQQHIPRKLASEVVEKTLAQLRQRIDALEAENARLRAGRSEPP